jgi:DHA1 family bicyclomycin/chloramphenicol resistance-like MFS transporter
VNSYYQLAVTLGALTAIGPLAIDMYLPALPTIARELGASASAVQVSVVVYFIGMAAGQAVYGPVSDRIGRKPALCFGLGLFLVSSIGCALASNVETLVAFRLAQSLGGCASVVIPRAVVRDYFEEREAVRMLSLLMLVFGLAPILAPWIGGQLLIGLGWRSIFWLHAVYAVFWLIVVVASLDESLPAERRRRDPLGVVVRVYGRLMSDRIYIGYVLTGSLIFAGLLAYIAGSPFVFIELFHVPPERYGLYFGTNAIGIISASQANRWLAHRVDPRRVLAVVLPVSLFAGLVLLFNAYTGFGGFGGILLPLFCFIATHGFVMPNTVALALAPHRAVAGSASALLGTLQFVLGATAGTLLGLIGNGTAVPLAAVVGGCGVAAFAVHRAFLPAAVRDERLADTGAAG